jgi:5-methylcytosine-specific restriction endonuclease McrA
MLTPQVIQAIKKSFSRSNFTKNFRNSRVLKNKKGVRGGKVTKCEVCGAEIPMYKAQIDHIKPVVPVMIPGKFMSFMYFYNRTFCKKSNLQILCPECHNIKSKEELSERVKWRKRKKYLICRSVYGSLIKVIPIINMKDFDEAWEIMNVRRLRKDADLLAKKLRKI